MKLSEFEIFKESLLQNNVNSFMEVAKPVWFNKIIDNTNSNKPIHIACNKGFFQIVEYLLTSKCNFEYSNKNGWRPLHHCCANGHLDIVQLLLEKDCDINCQTNDGMRPIHLACANGHLRIVEELIGKNCLKNCQTKQGWTPVHWAACNGHLEIVKLLIDKQCDTEVQDKDGCQPILIACAYGHIEIVKLLINNKTMESKGVNLSETSDIKFDDKCLEFLGRIHHSDQIFTCLKNVNCANFNKFFGPLTLVSINKAGLSVLELTTQQNIGNIIRVILNKPMTDDEIRNINDSSEFIKDEGKHLIEECCLYRCIKYRHIEGFKIFNTPQTINRPRKLIQNSFLEVAVEFFSRGFIKDILQKTIYDKEVWDKAKNDARETKQMETLIEILNREFVLTSRKQANISILHTAVCDNDPDMVKYILNNSSLADKDLNNPRIGTALAFAHMLHHKLCINILEQYDVDVNTQNKLLETSLHEAIASGMHMKCEYLIDNSVDIDRVNSMGLTALQCAVIKGFEDVCEKLLRKGADCTRYIENISQSLLDGQESILPLTKKENSLTLCIKIHGTIYSCFLDKVNNETIGNVQDSNENSLIHMATLCLQPEVCVKLLESGSVVDKKNSKSNTALMELLVEKSNRELSQDILDKMVSVVGRLVEYGADINPVSVGGGDSLLTLASGFHDERLMITLVSKSSRLNNVVETVFLFPFNEKWFDYAQKLTSILSDDFLLQNITKEIILLCLEHNKIDLVKMMFDKASDDVQQSVLEDIIYHSTQIIDEDLFILMIDKELKYPKQFENGETLLTNLLLERKFEMSKKLLSSKNGCKHVQMKNNKNRYPLNVAIDVGDIDMIDELIHESREFNEEDDEGRTPLTQLFEKISSEENVFVCTVPEVISTTIQNPKGRLMLSIKAIIGLGGYIDKVLRNGRMVIDFCTELDCKLVITRFYSNKKNKFNMLHQSL